MPPAAESSAFFPIRVVSNETGVNSITLRAWERRYGLLTPKRTEKGHRLYTEQDITLIKKVVALLDRGIPISQAKAIIDSGAGGTSESRSGQPSQWNQYLSQLALATEKFDQRQLSETLDEVSQFFPTDIAFRFLLLPFYNRLREQCESPLDQARLSFYAGILQGRLAALLNDTQEGDSQSGVILADLSGDTDLELLLTGVLLKPLGMRTLRLAGRTTTDVVSALLAQHWQAALLQLPATPDPSCLSQLQKLSSESGRVLFCTGHDAAQADALRKHGIIPLSGDLQKDALTIRDVLTGINE